jgi:ribosomal protein S18 acetylase RimI-like enzyme
MTDQTFSIEKLAAPASDGDVRALALLLVDTVESGAAVSFLSPLSLMHAEQWWRETLSSAHPKAVFLVARDAHGIVGTVQFQPAWAPNQPHRAEVVKLMVDKRCQGKGLGTRLMTAIEHAAGEAGYTLLTLDARSGGAAEKLYRHSGWIAVGSIPQYAVDPDGVNMHATTIFYKQLRP